MNTKVVNLFAGPGTGKSTNTAAVFAKLKVGGISAEIVHEFAKDLVWEDRQRALAFQPYIFGKQAYHVHRLLGQVQVVITDSPILLSSHIYSRHNAGYDVPGLQELAINTFRQWDTVNILLRRNLEVHGFVQAGRNQDEAEAQQLDKDIENLLRFEKVEFHEVPVLPGLQTADEIVSIIAAEL